VTIETAPTTLEVARPPVTAGTWWLPARQLTLTETWSEPPEALTLGRPVRRTVTLEAEGVTDDQLPPPPDLAADGLIVFGEAPERTTVIGVAPRASKPERVRQLLPRPGRYAVVEGRDGPVGRISYAWAIRPTSGTPAEVPAIVVPWFDTEAGEMRTAVLPPRTVAFRSSGRSLAELERDIGLAAVAAPASTPLRSAGDVALAGLVFLAAALGTTAALRRRLALPHGRLRRLWGRLEAGRLERRAARLARRGELAAAWRVYAALDARHGAGRAAWAAEKAALEQRLYGGGAAA